MTSSLESFMQLISVLVIFVFVLVITYVTTRWMAGFQKSRSYNKNLKIIETIAVGNNKLISIVAVGKKYIAVSVGKDDVHFLTEIKEDELKDLSFLDEAYKESAKESFANILEKLKKSHSDRSKNE